MIRRIHQFFFNFNGKALNDYPIFVASQALFKAQRGWKYKLWSERQVERLCRTRYPKLWPRYRRMLPIQQVDCGKYLVADAIGGLIADLDVLPRRALDEVVGTSDYVFDRCSRKGVIANDFFFVSRGLPGIEDALLENLARVDAIPAYRERRLRYIFQGTGPDFFTRYLKAAGLARYMRALSNRTFLDPKQRHRDVRVRGAAIDVRHHLSWQDQARPRL